MKLLLSFVWLAAAMAAPVRAQVAGVAEAFDRFGHAVAVGDFDGDGRDDLAVGVPDEDVGSATNAGCVNVLYGAAGAGLASAGNQLWHQDVAGVLDVAEESDHFGSALAAGDFDGDGYDDLAVGVRAESLGSSTIIVNAGAVHVLYGSAAGLTATDDQFWHQNSRGVEDAAEFDDNFGYALAAGDFDADGYDDLAVGAVFDDAGASSDAGVVNVLYGAAGAGLTATGDQVWHQDIAGMLETVEGGDWFGFALATGDFDGDTFDDLAVGVHGETVGTIVNAGATHVLYGSAGVGLTAAGDQVWHQNSVGIEGVAEDFEYAAYAVAAGDFDADGYDDLAITAHNDDVGTVANAGAVNVLYGTIGTGLAAPGDQLWHQDSSGVLDTAEGGDWFGVALAAGDFDGGWFDDLAIGVVQENVGTLEDAGAVNVLYGVTGVGLAATGNQFWHQDSSAPVPAVGDAGPTSGAAASGTEAPATPALHAARPNPFTARTAVAYDVAEAGRVRLVVYDLLGRAVAVLVDGEHAAGRYTVTLDGSHLAAGVYLVRMTAGDDFAQAQRVTVLE
jgi:hypothetical protein